MSHTEYTTLDENPSLPVPGQHDSLRLACFTVPAGVCQALINRSVSGNVFTYFTCVVLLPMTAQQYGVLQVSDAEPCPFARRYVLPLAELGGDFYDELKSRSSGYASFDYEDAGDRWADCCSHIHVERCAVSWDQL